MPKKYDLLSIPTRAPEGVDRKEVDKATKKYVKRLRELQNLFFANGTHSLLVVFQGMDASGKDGAVRDVFKGVNPQGVKVESFKAPSKEELKHDYLWRVHQHAPERGMIQIFNRSHYEEVLITRVEGWVSDEEARRRFRQLNDFERMLQENGTIILKFYLHISEESQQKDFYERIIDRRKNWKYGPEDFEKAKKWPLYRKMYEEAFENCGPDIPWHIVPSDQNWYKEHIIAKTIVETLEGLGMDYPKAQIDPKNPDVLALFEKFGYPPDWP